MSVFGTKKPQHYKFQFNMTIWIQGEIWLLHIKKNNHQKKMARKAVFKWLHFSFMKCHTCNY